jgi:16S rRNA (guanine966-N2)-methyltransferase
MRIIRGSHRGKQIVAPASLPVRPTTDYAKEGLFNILEPTFDFESLEVLDLFAGTGSISYEFASRGCKAVTAIDSNKHSTRFISQIAGELSFKNLNAICVDVFRFVTSNKKPYGLIFADPPYTLENLSDLPGLILNARMLYHEGWLVLEHSSVYDFSGNPYFIKHRKYGEVNFSFFEFSVPAKQNS